jgi:hypothetical protein
VDEIAPIRSDRQASPAPQAPVPADLQNALALDALVVKVRAAI